jgi:hypothetical protein
MAVWTNCFEKAVVENIDPLTKVVISSVEVGGDVATIKCLEPLFRNVVSAVGALAGVALFLMLIVGGYNFLFAGGDQKKLEKAKGTLTAAVIGLVLIALAYLIIKAIATITGTDLDTFKIFIQP